MKAQARPYHDPADLLSIGTLICETYKQEPFWNSWSFALYDIWAHRKLGDEQVFGKTAWQQGIRLWEIPDRRLAGAA